MGGRKLRAQYEALPYPPRNPEDERKRLIIGSPSHLDELDYYGFAGTIRQRPHPVRCLVAGGGTGDASIMLAQQLNDAGVPSEIHHVDLSAASCVVAEARAKIRGLSSLKVQTGSLFDLREIGMGTFDYIDCCGVLHHLEDPVAGLRHLASLLKPDGAMGLMVYGKFGRTGLYPLQNVARLLSAGEDVATSVGIAKRLVKHLPESNWFRRNPFLQDHLNAGDAGVHDLLLCPQDRAYDVLEVSRLATAAGMRLVAFIEPAAYDPATYLADATLLKRIEPLSWIRRCAIAECLSGALRKHVFYVVRGSNRVHPLKPDNEAAVPVLRDLDAITFAKGFRPGQALTARLEGVQLRRMLPPLSGALIRRVDGMRDAGAIIDDVSHVASGKSRDQVAGEWRDLFVALNGLGKLYSHK